MSEQIKSIDVMDAKLPRQVVHRGRKFDFSHFVGSSRSMRDLYRDLDEGEKKGFVDIWCQVLVGGSLIGWAVYYRKRDA